MAGDPLPTPEGGNPDVELHPDSGLRPGAWWACHEPERPPVPGVTAFDFRCRLCAIAADAVRHMSKPGTVRMTRRTRTGLELPGEKKLEDYLADHGLLPRGS